MSSINDIAEERLNKIEMKLAYLEDFVNQLQNVSVGQANEIERLKNEYKVISEKLHDVSDMLEGDIPNRKPPHY